MRACHVGGARAADQDGRGAARRGAALLVVLLALLLGGCQLRVATDVVVDVDGSGSVTLRIVADKELAATLEEAGVDVLDGLDAAAAGADWRATPLTGDEGVGVELQSDFATPDELGRRVAELSAALTEDDGALLRDVELVATEDGGWSFTATGGIDPPRIVGSLPLDEGPVRFDGDDLAAALEEGGADLARHDLRVTFPTVPVAPGAEVSTTSATWSLPNHELATVSATAPPLPLDRRLVFYVAGGLAAALVGAFVVRLVQRGL